MNGERKERIFCSFQIFTGLLLHLDNNETFKMVALASSTLQNTEFQISVNLVERLIKKLAMQYLLYKLLRNLSNFYNFHFVAKKLFLHVPMIKFCYLYF